jgi:hypothetical protein
VAFGAAPMAWANNIVKTHSAPTKRPIFDASDVNTASARKASHRWRVPNALASQPIIQVAAGGQVQPAFSRLPAVEVAHKGALLIKSV